MQDVSGWYSTNSEETNSKIADYYANLTTCTGKLQSYLDKASIDVSQGYLLNEERRDNRIHPEESTKSREILLGIVPTLKPTSIPYLMSAAVAMACITIFLIFQMNGISGQLTLPPAFVTWLATPSTLTLGNPLVLGGIAIVLLAAAVIFAVLYYKSKNTNRG